MSANEKRAWAWRQDVNVGDQSTLQALADLTNGSGEGVVDEEALRAMTGHGDRSLTGSLHILAQKGLIRGLRWTQTKGWNGSKIRLVLSEEPKHRHLAVVA